MSKMFSHIVGDTPEQQAVIDEIMRRGEEERRQIARENLLDNTRIAGGALLSGASALPIFNIPYIGTGIGGAMEGAGNAIMQGKSGKDIATDAGIGFAIGETVGAIPYAGKFAGKTKAGQAVINKANGLYDKLMATDAGKKVSDFAKKAEDVLMADIKAFNPNKQTVYHGSPYDFAKFSNEAIGTGEGAQAHGMGHYTAKSKDIADRYREDLTNIKNDVWNVNEINYKGNKYTDDDETRKFSYLKDIAYGKYNKKDQLKILENRRKDYLQMNSPKSVIKQIDDEINFVKNIDAKEFDNINKGQLYKLSIPKDDVMLREYASFSEQPLTVQRGLEEIRDKTIKEKGYKSIDEVRERLDAVSAEYEKAIREQAVPFWAWGSTPVSNYQIELSKLERLNNMFDYGGSNKDIYKNLAKQLGKEEASNLLNQHGIKGISYNGGIDGEARVIFNPDDIEIVRKYYNQPELYSKILGESPNVGAVSSGVTDFDNMSKAEKKAYRKGWKEYAKENLVGSYTFVPNYGYVDFSNKNLAKDYLHNLEELPYLQEQLKKSKYAFTSNKNNEKDRVYDHLYNSRNSNLYDYLIERVTDNNGKTHRTYKMMKNKTKGDK